MKSGRDCYLNLFRYYHTLKNLKFCQIFNYLFKKKSEKLKPKEIQNISALAENLRNNFSVLNDSEKQIEFSFFNQPISIDLNDIGWLHNDFKGIAEKHWLKELNSFEWIDNKKETKLNNNQISYIVLSWIAKNNNELSETWESNTLSKRIFSWVKWVKNNKIKPEILSIVKISIYLQLKRLCFDFDDSLGNELLENFKGFIAGCSYLIDSKQYFDNVLEYQLSIVLKSIKEQINEQILKDGAHFERSPMYHLFMLDNIKEIRKIALFLSEQRFLLPEILENSLKIVALCDEKIPLMTEWLKIMTMPDGEVVQFNDSTRLKGISSKFDNFTKLFDISGFFVKHNNDYSFILSCGAPSPTYLPEHSHCDILSYEFAIGDKRLIIDSGCNGYDNETLRQMCRETEAHNLPMIQGQEQSDIWGVNYFGKRARILKRKYIESESKLELVIEDQFRQIIQRDIIFSKKHIIINDSLKKRRINGNFITLIHLAPGIEPEVYPSQDDLKIIYCKVNEILKFNITTSANVRIGEYISFPDFCKSMGAKMLIFSNKEKEVLNYDIKW